MALFQDLRLRIVDLVAPDVSRRGAARRFRGVRVRPFDLSVRPGGNRTETFDVCVSLATLHIS